MEKHVCEEEDEEGEAVENEDVGDVRDACVGDELHLLFCGTHEEEARGIEQLYFGQQKIGRSEEEAYERRDVLPAVGIAILGDGVRIPEDDRNFNYPRQARGH